MGVSLLLAAMLTACFEGPSVATTGTEDELAQAEGDAGPEGGDLAGSEARRDGSTDSQLVDQAQTREEPKPPAATTEPADTTVPEVDEEDSTEDAPEDDGTEDEGDAPEDDGSDGDDDDDDSDGDGPSGPPEDGSDAGLAATSVAYVNGRRSEAGLGALAGDPELTEMADSWARQMLAEQDLHHNPNLGAQMPAGYGTIGENIAYSTDPTTIDGMWWDSDGHRANILGSSYTHIGVAFVEDDQGTTWAVQVFAG